MANSLGFQFATTPDGPARDRLMDLMVRAGEVLNLTAFNKELYEIAGSESLAEPEVTYTDGEVPEVDIVVSAIKGMAQLPPGLDYDDLPAGVHPEQVRTATLMLRDLEAQ